MVLLGSFELAEYLACVKSDKSKWVCFPRMVDGARVFAMETLSGLSNVNYLSIYLSIIELDETQRNQEAYIESVSKLAGETEDVPTSLPPRPGNSIGSRGKSQDSSPLTSV